MAPRHVSLDDLVSFPFAGVADASLSCDGRTVVCAAGGTLRRLDPGGGEVDIGPGYGPRHSPVDPERLSFQRAGREEIGVFEGDAGERWIGVGLRRLRRTAWSPDGRLIAVLADAAGPDGLSPAGTPTIQLQGTAEHGRRGRLVVLDARSGEHRLDLESEPDAAFQELAWHPGSNLLTVLVWLHEPGWGLRWLLRDVDVGTGRSRNRLDPAPREVECPRWSPDGTRLAFAYCPYDSMNMVRDVCAVTGKTHGDVRLVNQDYYVTDLTWTPDSRFLVGTGIAGLTRHVFRVDVATGRCERLSASPGRYRLRGMDRDGRSLLLLHQGLTGVQEVQRADLATGEVRALTRAGAAMAATLALSEPEIVRWTSTDGLPLEGVLVRALSSATPDGVPPATIVDLHGGPAGGGEAVFRPEWQWLAAEGFHVFAPGYRGSQQFGRFAPPTEDADLQDIVSGVRALTDRGVCVAGRIGLHGFSHGAHLGAWILGHTEVFGAAVLVGGCYDWRLAYGIGSNTFGNSILAMDFGGRPWEVPETYARLSAMTFASRVTAAVLLLQGGDDNRAQAELYGTWLRGAGKTVAVVVYEGDGHPPRKPEHVRDRWSRTAEWFRKHLVAAT